MSKCDDIRSDQFRFLVNTKNRGFQLTHLCTGKRHQLFNSMLRVQVLVHQSATSSPSTTVSQNTFVPLPHQGFYFHISCACVWVHMCGCMCVGACVCVF